jgi:hypothetical protein
VQLEHRRFCSDVQDVGAGAADPTMAILLSRSLSEMALICALLELVSVYRKIEPSAPSSTSLNVLAVAVGSSDSAGAEMTRMLPG